MPSANLHPQRTTLARLLACAALTVAASTAIAGGPRFVTGTNLSATGPGAPMVFYTASPLYFTDPGSLAANVTHAQADAIVAAAAAVWNVPTSSLTLAQGGTLSEHVSSANAYFNGTDMVFPADVQASNYLAKPIAILYDTDGSLTDLLLGSGASSPSSCRQNGVTESVDGFGQNGTIQHALLILNGRCVGSTPQQLTQMQYQLMRAFGRILGLAWSQLNDNVFTGATQPTANNLANWPVMHPIDVICGLYTYQCMQNPFSLRYDDLSSLALLYPVTAANLTAGKTLSLDNAAYMFGLVTFPTGQGMDMVNVTATRLLNNSAAEDSSQIASGVSGVLFAQNLGNPVTGPASDAQNSGRNYSDLQGEYVIARIPLPGGGDIFLHTESINPLYTGAYALGPFERPPTTISGPPIMVPIWSAWADQTYRFDAPMTTAASTCAPGSDGYESSPAPSDPSGWWSGQLCAMGHTSWGGVTVQPKRTWTLETTALDDDGLATNYKAQPLLGVWNAADPTGTEPTVASTPAPMNALAVGVTQLHMSSSTTPASYRFVIADQFGAGRPDYIYTARILYADTIAPATVGAGGGLITLTGTGFRQGNEVLVNGAPATVNSWTATQIIAIAPTSAAAKATPGTPQTVEVLDASTGATATIASALTYSTAPDLIQLTSAPTSLETGTPSATPFAVQVLTSDGLAPAAGASVRFAVTSGSATLGCGASTCTLTTDAAGHAQTTITGNAAGSITLTATELSGGASVQITLTDTNPILAATIAKPTAYVAAGANASWIITLFATLDAVPAAGIPIAWSTTNPALTLTPAQSSTTTAGTASVSINAVNLAASTTTITGCVWTIVCATWTLTSVDPSQWRIAATSGAKQSITAPAQLSPVTLLVTDTAAHPLPGAAVILYQTVTAWEGTCPARGRCPSAPILTRSQSSTISDANGLLVVAPIQLATTPQAVNLAASTGTQGFAALTLDVAP
jgi:hypothetical protein